MNTTTTLAKQASKPKALELMAGRLNLDPSKMLTTLKSTVFAKASDEELAALVVVSNEYGLNPFLKEIYAFPAKGGGIVPVVGVDGWNKMMIRNPDFDGIEFEFQESAEDASSPPVSCTATVFLKNRSKPVKVTEFYDECHRDTDPWKKMPRRMLRHKALIQASRVAFGFSGIFDEEEAIDISATVINTESPTPKRISQVKQVESGNVHDEMQQLLDANDLTFNLLTLWGEESGNIPDATSFGTLAEIPTETIKRLLRNRDGMITAINAAKESTKR